MGGHRLGGALVARGEELGSEPYALPRRRAGADAPQHEPEERQSNEVDVIGGAPERVVVAEPRGQLAGIDRAAHRRQEGDVVGGLALGRRSADPLPESGGDQTRAESVLGRLPETQVDTEREGGDQLG